LKSVNNRQTHLKGLGFSSDKNRVVIQ